MKKRILSLVLALSMMISLFPVSALAQTPGGGTAEMAEENGEDIDAANGADVTTIQIDSNGEPVGDDGANGKNWEYDSNLTLKKGTYTFSAPVTCGVIIYNGATVVGGTFEGTVWNEVGGKISGGTFKKAVSNKGTINGGIFVGVDSGSTSVINYDTGKITGGVFKVLPSNGIDSAANQYRIEFADDSTDTLSVNGVDFVSNKVYVVGMDNEELTITANNTDLTNVNQTRNSATSSKTITFKPGSVKQESEKNRDTYLLKLNAELYEAPLVMTSNGVPDTSNMTQDAEGVYHGNNWTYGPGGRYGRLTLTSGEWNFSNTKPVDGTGSALSAVNCIVQINDGATVKGGTFKIVVNNGVYDRENNIRVKGGIIAGGTFKSSVNNCGGTIKNGEFTHCVNDNLGDAKGTIEGGTFASNGNFDSVTNYGIISGGTFNGLVTSYWSGIIEKGTFNGKVSNYGSIDGGYFLSVDNTYDTASTVSGGVFKTISSKVESTSNLYKIQFDSESGAATTNTLSVDNHDFGMTSVYAVGTDDTELTVTAKDKILTSVNNKANTTASSNSITFKLGEVKLADEKDGNAYLLKLNAKLYNSELEIGEDGKPNTSNAASREEDNKTIWYGTGWTYDGNRLTLTSGEWDFSDAKTIKCDVTVNSNVVVNGGTFKAAVVNNGTIKTSIFYGSVTNNKKMEYVSFMNCDRLTNSAGASMANVTVRAYNNDNLEFSNSGSIKDAVFDFKPNCENERVLREANDATISAGVVGCKGLDRYNLVYGSTLYVIGTPTLVIKLGSGTLITNVNGNTSYGGLTADKDQNNYQKFTVQSEDTELVLNQSSTTKTYTLTLTGATADPAQEQYTEGQIIKLAAEDAADGKEFDKWALHGLTLVDGCQKTNATIKVTITGNATAKATYKDKVPTTYTLTVEDGYIGTDENQTSGNYEAGATIKLTAKAKTGYHFTKWTVEEGTLSLSEEELKANPLTFEMPDGAVSLKANYEEDTPDPVDPNPTPNPDDQPTTYTITTDIYGEVNGGASATVKENDWVHMTVAEVPEGMTFDYWNIPDALLKALQKQNSGFRNNVESLSFQMPDMGEEEQTFAIKANFRSSELPGEDDGPSTLGTMATVAVGGAAAGILVWQGVSLGVDSYLQLNLPKGVAVPTNRRELVKLLWETAGKPEAALPSLYSDVPAEEIELQKATRWAIDNGLVKPADESDASRFDPDRYVTKYDVFGAWLKLKKLMK